MCLECSFYANVKYQLKLCWVGVKLEGCVRPQAELRRAGNNRAQGFPLIVKLNKAVIHLIVVQLQH